MPISFQTGKVITSGATEQLRHLRVLHIAETARGGVGIYIDLLTELERGAIHSRVILPDAHADMVSPLTERRSYARAGRSLKSLWRFALTALAERRAFQPDIVFCHSTFSLIALVLLKPLARETKFIYCAHGWAGARDMDSPAKAQIVRWVEGWLCGLADRIINVSAPDQDHARRHGYRGVHIVIENAVRAPRAEVPPPQGKDDIRLLFVGRLDRQKGIDLLLAAFARAKSRNPKLQLDVVGESVISPGAAPPPATKGVRFLGWLGADAIDACYQAADLLVMPSRWEGLPLVLLEALRNGLPALLSDRSGLPSLIEPGKSGLVAPLSEDCWVEVLASVDKVELNSMRPAAKALYARRYCPERFQAEISALYRALTAPTTAPPPDV